MLLLPFFCYFLLRISVLGQKAVTVKHNDFFLNQPVDGDFSIIDEYHKQVAHLPSNQFMDVQPQQNLLNFPSRNLLDLQPPPQGLMNVPMHNLLNLQTPLHTYAYFSEPGPPSFNSYPGLAYYLGQYGQEKDTASSSPHLAAKLRSYQSTNPLPVADEETEKPKGPQHPKRRIYQTQETEKTITLPQSTYQVRTPENLKLEGNYGEPIRPIVSVGGKQVVLDPNDSIKIRTGVARVMIGRRPSTTPLPIDKITRKTDDRDPFGMTDEEYQEFVPTIAVEPSSEENEEAENLAEETKAATGLPSLLKFLSTASVYTEDGLDVNDEGTESLPTSTVPSLRQGSAVYSSTFASSTSHSTSPPSTTNREMPSTRSPGLEKIDNVSEILTVTDEYEVVDRLQTEESNQRTTVAERTKGTTTTHKPETTLLATHTTQTPVTVTSTPVLTTASKTVKTTKKAIHKTSPTSLLLTTPSTTTPTTTVLPKKTKTTAAVKKVKKTTVRPTTKQVTETTKAIPYSSTSLTPISTHKEQTTTLSSIPEKEFGEAKDNIPERTTIAENTETATTKKSSTVSHLTKSRVKDNLVSIPTHYVTVDTAMMDLETQKQSLLADVPVTRVTPPSTTLNTIPLTTKKSTLISTSTTTQIPITTTKEIQTTYKSYKMERLSIWEILGNKKANQSAIDNDDVEDNVLMNLDNINPKEETTPEHKLKKFQTLAPNTLFAL